MHEAIMLDRQYLRTIVTTSHGNQASVRMVGIRCKATTHLETSAEIVSDSCIKSDVVVDGRSRSSFPYRLTALASQLSVREKQIMATIQNK